MAWNVFLSDLDARHWKTANEPLRSAQQQNNVLNERPRRVFRLRKLGLDIRALKIHEADDREGAY